MSTYSVGTKELGPSLYCIHIKRSNSVGGSYEYAGFVIQSGTDNSRSYTIDFHENRTVVQERNIQCDLVITKIVTDNVATLEVSKNSGTVQTLSLTAGVWEGTLNVNEGDLLVWQISRTTENSIAEINIKYEY